MTDIVRHIVDKIVESIIIETFIEIQIHQPAWGFDGGRLFGYSAV